MGPGLKAARVRKPDLFIVGAAKSGTTSMERYLGSHPQIFMAGRSEMHFFGTDLDVKYRIDDLDEYLAEFASAGDAVAAGEKSIGYLFSKTAAAEIFDFNPDARIVIMLRNPVDMVFSLHRQFVRSGNEDLVDFEAALAAQTDRRSGRRMPPTVHKADMLQYLDVVTYTPQVERYLERFGDNVVVLLFEDLKRDPLSAYEAVLRLVGADDPFRPEFDVHNPTIDLPSVALRRQMARFPAASAMFRRLVSSGLRRRLRRASAVFQSQPNRTMTPALREELRRQCAPDVAALSELLGRDLSSW